MDKSQEKINSLTSEATSDVKSAIEAAYYEGFRDCKNSYPVIIYSESEFNVIRDRDGSPIAFVPKNVCPHSKISDIIREVLIRT